MIIRIQQLAVEDAERLGGWPEHGPAGAIAYQWPASTAAFELTVREMDEQNRAISPAARRDHLKSVIPTLVESLKQPDEAVIVRLDGPLAEGELLGALAHLTDGEGYGRFAMSAVEKLDEG